MFENSPIVNYGKYEMGILKSVITQSSVLFCVGFPPSPVISNKHFLQDKDKNLAN